LQQQFTQSFPRKIKLPRKTKSGNIRTILRSRLFAVNFFFHNLPFSFFSTLTMGSQPVPLRQSIDDVPDELVVKIISQVTDHLTLYSIVFTSRRLYRISLPFLYRTISQQMYKHPPMVHAAIRTLLKKPELAQRVEAVALRHPRQCENFSDLKSWARYEQIQPRYSGEVQGLTMGFKCSWAKEKYRAALQSDDHSLFLAGARRFLGGISTEKMLIEREEAQVALLLSLCPNLERLYLENPSTPAEKPRFVLDHLVLEILHPKIRDGTMLQSLQSLTAITSRMEGGQGGFRLASIATFFFLPNLRYVQAAACFEPEDELFEHFECPPSQSAVREIKFHRSAICPLGLSEMIKACKALEQFDCDWVRKQKGIKRPFSIFLSSAVMLRNKMLSAVARLDSTIRVIFSKTPKHLS
jgi:hypothetical protein